jgi:hypothetical protein
MTTMPAASVAAKAWSWPTKPCTSPPLDRTRVPAAMSALATARRALPGWVRSRAYRTPDPTAPTKMTVAPIPLPTAASARGKAPKVRLATGMPVRAGDDAGGEAGEEHDEPLGPAAGAGPEQEVDRAERQPRHVEHRAEQEEHPVGAAIPPVRGPEGEGGGREGEERQRHGPVPQLAPVALRGRSQRRLGEQGGDGGGHERQPRHHLGGERRRRAVAARL